MVEPKWYVGVPPVEAVAAHETEHPRTDRIRLGRITVSRGDFNIPYEDADDLSYGDWLCLSRMPIPHVGMVWLKAHNGEVLIANGMSFWQPLATFRYISEHRYFPVGQNGLPLDYRAPVPKVTITDSEALRKVKPEALETYLLARNWTLFDKQHVQFGRVYQQLLGQYSVEVVVPTTMEIGDYVHRIADALHNLAIVEGRSQLDIWRELTASGLTVQADPSTAEFLARLDRSVEWAERQPSWAMGQPENRRNTCGHPLTCRCVDCIRENRVNF